MDLELLKKYLNEKYSFWDIEIIHIHKISVGDYDFGVRFDSVDKLNCYIDNESKREFEEWVELREMKLKRILK